jgi:hypothetical protein
MRNTLGLSFLAAMAAALCGGPAQAQQAPMTFFVTSVGKGNGADLGGLEGADAHCLSLAKAAGSTLTNWRAYLSTTLPGGDAGVNARDRIGNGPWYKPSFATVGSRIVDPCRMPTARIEEDWVGVMTVSWVLKTRVDLIDHHVAAWPTRAVRIAAVVGGTIDALATGFHASLFGDA